MDEKAVRGVIERYGQGMSAGDLAAISACWDVPAFAMSAQGATLIATKGEIEQFYDQTVRGYHARGLVRIVPEFERVAQIAPGLASADVHWSIRDENDNQQMDEHILYILRQNPNGEPVIQVVVNKD